MRQLKQGVARNVVEILETPMATWKKVLLGDALTFQRGVDITKAEQRILLPVISTIGRNLVWVVSGFFSMQFSRLIPSES